MHLHVQCEGKAKQQVGVLLRARPHPRTEHWARGVSGGSGDEFVSAFTKCTISTKGDGLKADVVARNSAIVKTRRTR